MKVGDEAVDRAKAIRRTDENPRFAASLDECPVKLNGSLQDAYRSRADGPDIPSAITHIVQCCCGSRGEGEGLLVHDVLRRILDLDGLEGSRTDVEQHVGPFHTALLQVSERLIC